MVLLSMSACSSVDNALARCSGGNGFNSCQGLRFFPLSHARVKLICSLFTTQMITRFLLQDSRLDSGTLNPY